MQGSCAKKSFERQHWAREGGLLRLRGGKHGGVKAKELWEKVTPRRVPCFLSARAWG